MLMSPTQSGSSARQALANSMGLPAGRFLPLPPIGASSYKYRSISESDRIPAQGWNEETEKDFGQRNGSAASGAKFRNCACRHARHSRYAEASAKTQEAAS